MSDMATVSYGSEDDDLYIHHIRRTEPFERTNHFHRNYEVYYLLSGERLYFIKDRSFTLQQGDLVFINKLDLHSSLNAENPQHERVLINFSDAYANDYADNRFLFEPFTHPSGRVLSLNMQERMFVEQLLLKLTKEAHAHGTGFELYMKHLLIELLLFASRYLEKHKTTAVAAESPLHGKVTEIVRFINLNYALPLTLNELSERFYMSPHYLSRSFKKVTGFSFVEYVNAIRVKEAQRLLKETENKIIDIADHVGFESIAHFGRVFKAVARISPLQYRKQE
ncbi:helix-turn-helix domain-containing protein [Paenibacillus sp. MBLB4367]|uniref:AraC family transcriptional regulator n=1 Tax=Paenibacillus sp. MBLB4367 TaxID=3384767 RepID=UPI003908144E